SFLSERRQKPCNPLGRLERRPERNALIDRFSNTECPGAVTAIAPRFGSTDPLRRKPPRPSGAFPVQRALSRRSCGYSASLKRSARPELNCVPQKSHMNKLSCQPPTVSLIISSP